MMKGIYHHSSFYIAVHMHSDAATDQCTPKRSHNRKEITAFPFMF